MRLFLAVITFLIFSMQGFAQNTCVQSLDRAKQLFEEGHLYDVPGALEECLEKGFSKDQKIQAYHLLSMTYLYLDRPEEAEESYIELLRHEPEFDVEEDNDQIEINYLDSKFTTTPIFILNGRLGINRSTPVIINNYGVQEDPETYYSKYGFHIGGGVDLSLNDNFRLGLELNYRRTNFDYEALRFGEDLVEVSQHYNNLSTPFYLKYTRKTGSFFTYVYGGVMFDYLLRASGDFNYLDINTTDTEVEDGVEALSTDLENVNLTILRNRTSLNLVGGLGFKYRIGYKYVFIEFRYIGGLKNLVDVDNRIAPPADGYLYDLTSLFTYTYIDDDFRVNTFGVTIGIENPLYKPRKIEKGKPLLHKIFGK